MVSAPWWHLFEIFYIALGSIFYKGKALSNDFSTELDPKQQNVRNN